MKKDFVTYNSMSEARIVRAPNYKKAAALYALASNCNPKDVQIFEATAAHVTKIERL